MLPLWLCIPFAGLLLCIAIMPLVKAEWWESHQIHAVIFWSLLFIIPYAVTKGASTAAETVLECIINDYLSFIILLFGLFCVTGNISVDGDLVCWFMFESVVDTVLQIHDITYCYASYFLERQFDVPHIALFA